MMNWKGIFTGLAGLLTVVSVNAQQKITLSDALEAAAANYPNVQQKQLLKMVSQENQQLLEAGLYPQLSIAGQATYQSEVTKFEMPGIPSDIGQKPGNYNVGLELRLPLTQFGTAATRKRLEQAQTDVAVSQIDVDIQHLKERITGLFGNLLLQKENAGILFLRLSDLDSQLQKVTVAVANGAVLKSNQLVLESEILGTRQRIDDIQSTIKGLTSELAILTGLNINPATQFELVDMMSSPATINRPELKVLAEQKNVLKLQTELTKKETHPNVYVFGQGNFGRPGYNFLDNDARMYGIAGVGLSWNLNNIFNQSKKQRTIEISRQIIDKQMETFTLSLNATLASKKAEIEKYENMIAKDAQIVSNRKEIIRAARSQLENGVITSTEYLTELNAENAAELNLVLHQVQLSVAKAQYNTLSGY